MTTARLMDSRRERGDGAVRLNEIHLRYFFPRMRRVLGSFQEYSINTVAEGKREKTRAHARVSILLPLFFRELRRLFAMRYTRITPEI